MNRRDGMMAAVIGIIFSGCCAAADPPTNNPPSISALPAHDRLILDVRATAPLAELVGNVRVEAGVINVDNHGEYQWELPSVVPLPIARACNPCAKTAWAEKSRQLLVALDNAAYLIESDGRFKKLALQLPGVDLTFANTDEFAISDDGQMVAFRVYGRDAGDKTQDPADTNWRPGDGRLYDDLMYESIQGSKPISAAKSDGANFVPAWSPDGSRIAYVKRVGLYNKMRDLIVADIGTSGVVSTTTVASVPGAEEGELDVSEVRWSPDGKSLGFLAVVRLYKISGRRIKNTLYTVNGDGSVLQPVSFGKDDVQVFSFAWSPSGTQFALRTSYESKTTCSLNPLGFMNQGGRDCTYSQNIFTSNRDGSGLTRVSREPIYRFGKVFWVQ